MFSAHHDDNKKLAGSFHTSKRDVPPPLASRTQSEEDLLSLIDNFRFGPSGAISTSPNSLKASPKAEQPRKRALSNSGVLKQSGSNVVGGTLNVIDSPGARRSNKEIRSKHSPPSGSSSPTAPSSPSPVLPFSHNHKIEASLYLPSSSSSSPSPTGARKKTLTIEKGLSTKRRPSPMGSKVGPAPHSSTSSKHDDDERVLEVVGQGPRPHKPIPAFSSSNNINNSNNNNTASGSSNTSSSTSSSSSSGGSKRSGDREDGSVNPLQDLLQNRINESEFANIIERQPAEMRWMSIRDLAAQVKRLITLLTFTTSISSELDLDRSSEKVSQQVCEILNADRASLYLIEEGKSVLVSKSTALTKTGKAQPMSEIRVPMGKGIAGHVALSGATLNVSDASKETLFFSDVDKQTGYKTKTVLCMPVVDHEGTVVAVVEALNKRKPGGGIETFDGEDERVMKTLAHHAGISLRNSQLYQSSLLAQRRIQVLLEVASQLASELETTSLITQIMTKARDLLDADRCTLFLLDAERGELWSKVAEGSKEIRVPVTKGISGHVVTTGEILNIKDAYEDQRFNPEIDRRTGYRTKSILCMPLRNNKQEIIGVTQMINKKDGGIFEDQDEVLLKAFSSQAAVALENAKLFAKTNEMRNYLQSIIQSITNLVLSLDLGGNFLSSNHPTEKFLGVGEEEMRVNNYRTWLGEENTMLANHIQMVLSTNTTMEKTDYELVTRSGGKLSINYKVVPLLDSTNHISQGVVVIIEDVTPQKRMMSTLNRYMSPALAEQVVKEGGDRLGGVHLTVSTLFADIRNFTPMSEGMDAGEVVAMLNEYFSYMVGVVFDKGGVLDKYIGDAMMAVFGVPFPAHDDPLRACAAALEMLRRLTIFNDKRKANGEPPVSIGIGINTGKVLSGNIGSDKRLEYTVIGDGVNLASRIEGITKSYGVKVLLSEFTYKEVKNHYITREIDAIRVVGKQQPVKVYELLGSVDSDVDPALLKNISVYESALVLYRERKFQEAMEKFQYVAREAADAPSYIFMKRCDQMLKDPPGPSWNGVYDFASK